jgi:hypothetical protein
MGFPVLPEHCGNLVCGTFTTVIVKHHDSRATLGEL